MLASRFRASIEGARRYVREMNLPAANARFRVAIHRVHGAYFAHVTDLPGCFSRGASEVEAVENARNAIRAYLWLARALADESATVQIEICA